MILHDCAVFALFATMIASHPSYSQSLGSDPLLGQIPQPSALAAISELEVSPWDPSSEIDIQTLIVPPVAGSGAGSGFDREIPFAVPNSIILTLRPDITPEELDRLIEERGLIVRDTYPNLNAIQAETDLSEFFFGEISDNSGNDMLLRGAINAAESFRSNPSVIAATPDFLYETQQSTEQQIVVSSPPIPLQFPTVEAIVEFDAAEMQDWGISDIEADNLWSQSGARDGGLLGVMDVGFNRHEDLVFLGPDLNNPPNNHGNHVAGIACARHNGVGVRGVVPNCLIVPRSGDFFPVMDEGGNILNFLTRFSMIMRTLDTFVSSSNQVRVYNVSLGYNWISNFGINIDSPEAAQFRQLAALQGENLLNALVRADEQGAIIVSAAGNDSRGLSQPIQAQFSSPFNWAAIEARSRLLARNVLIVEAHDDRGVRAPFSNIAGDISCPGVEVLSTIALNSQGESVRDSYGMMSGTSMASPYCAGGALLLTLLRPQYSGSEIVDCMITSTDISSSGTPMLRLTQALEACPPM